MTSNHFSKILNNLLWFVVYTLPLFVYIGVSIKTGTFSSFGNVFYDMGLDLHLRDNPIYEAFDTFFGPEGFLPIFESWGIFRYATYIAGCFLVRFILEVILWLVRWAHDLMDKGGKDLWK